MQELQYTREIYLKKFLRPSQIRGFEIRLMCEDDLYS